MPINRWFNKEKAPTWGVAAVRRRLEPEWSEGQRVDERWTLVEISAVSSVVVVSFRRRLDDTIARVHLRVRDDQRPAYLRTDNVDLWYVPGKGEDGDAARELVERCAERLRARGDDERYRLATREASAPEAFNLALASPCAQQCAFCSLKTTGLVGPQPQDVERLKRRLSESAGSGAHILRVNGIEPLRSPYLFELLAHARAVGFRQYDVFSTCRPLADADFAARFLAAISPRYRIYIPLYGASAATHDAFTGSPGAFDELMRAVDNIRAAGTGHYQFSTVLMRDNLAELPDLAALTARLDGDWFVHLPFPNTASPNDRYVEVATRHTEALAAVYPAGGEPLAELALGEIMPCVAFRHQRATGHALLSPSRLRRARLEQAGTHYASASIDHGANHQGEAGYAAPTVPCPHRRRCALASVCPAKVYSQYERRFGLDEFEPVSVEQLSALRGGWRLKLALRAGSWWRLGRPRG